MATAEQTSASPLTIEAFSRLQPRQKLAAMLVLAFAIALLVGSWLWTKEPPYSVLFANLSEKDGGQIIAALQQQNVPYKYSEGGGAILVPGTMVHDARLRLASQGLPRGGLVGFELMENQKLGISQFAEQINYQRGLEGELARSIQSLAAVRGARVHLAIPKQTAFLRDEQKPSASVLVNLYAGRTLEPAQVAGIVHLVSASVPQLNPAYISVIDQDGNLISQQQDSLKNAGLDPTQLRFVREIEQAYIKRIEEILTPMIGAGNVRARVTADVDFSQSEQVAETYRPNPNPDTAIRSLQTAETATNSPDAVGVPGALTNQPPVPATAPLTTPAAPGTPGATAATANKLPLNFSKNATTNFEVDKTVRHTKGAPGSIRRMSVAVVVNHKRLIDKDGKPGKAVPLTAAEIKQVTDIVREAMGFSQARGDTLNVANAPFTPPEKEVIPDSPIWKDPQLLALLKELGKYLIFGVIAWLTWTRLLRPLFDRLATMVPPPVVGPSEVEREMANDTEHRMSYDHKLASAREMAKQDPKMMANMIKEWVGGSEQQG
ncbi:MAG: flagellar M-ring protein FliF [Gammaproteobacteria bacterium]|nr:flagellar M-ring protein FliF [Gammaproteobacteria bacterium]MBU1646192.1 flagellar M-ring protein FliF [Gammaproteobacteria bacterium]MBU1972254.1 flagellar M-ring protein FliF [Gammaproteobacteria bacterium]